MTEEEFKELWWNDELEEVDETIDDSWRHGNHYWTVFKYGDEYWEAAYSVSGDGEEHGIRDDNFSIRRVYPVTKTVTITEYVATPPTE